MKSVKRLSRYTSILLSMLLMLSAMSPGLTALAQEKANAAPAVLTYEDDSITAELKATEGTSLPAGAALNVKALNKDSQDEAEKALYAQTEAGLNAKASEQGSSIDGFTAYSITLTDKNKRDITPKTGSFTLKITDKNAAAPEAYKQSPDGQKSIALYQAAEAKDEQNNPVSTMEPKQEDAASINTDPDGNITGVETALTTLKPVAVTWQNPQQQAMEEENAPSVQSEEEQSNALAASYDPNNPGPLTTVETIDSASMGVDIQMFDYERSLPDYTYWGRGQNGMLVQGLVNKELHKNSYVDEYYPETAEKDQYSTGLFNNFVTKGWKGDADNQNYLGKANHLFREDVYTGTVPKIGSAGTFYYSSFDNYAYWPKGAEKNVASDEDGTYPFTVYQQIGTPKSGNDSTLFYYQRGNFMPYNPIKDGEFADKTLNCYDENGKALNSDDARYREKLYKTQKPEWSRYPLQDGNAHTENNYYFGMVVTANFIQQKNGKYNGQDMVYKFNGDDDMWVFIDGVLVLDLGGVRDAQSGEINFSTGEVKWTNYNSTHTINEGNLGEGCKDLTKTIKDQFKDTSKENITEWNNNGEGDTFADYTGHEIKIFYMERGAGASNCKMQFNLPTVPKDSISVTKEVTNVNEGAYTNVDFDFKLYVQDNDAKECDTNTIKGTDGKIYRLKTDQPYDLKEETDIIKEDQKTNEETGIFTLKHGQTAYFKEIAEQGTKYIVQEVGVNQNQYDEIKVNGEAVDGNGGSITESADGKIVQTKPLTVGTDAVVKMQNHCDGENHQTINITKQIDGGQASEENFTAQVTIGGKPYTGAYTIVDKDDKVVSSKESCENGEIQLKASQTIRIADIAAGTSFEVTETNYNKSTYKDPSYAIAENTATDISTATDKASGKVQFGSHPKITITNHKNFSENNLEISKTAKVKDWTNRTYTITLTAYSTAGEVTDATIKDTIDPRFEVVDESGNRLADNAAVEGGTLRIEDSRVYIYWENQTLGTEEGSWTKNIHLKAKEDYVGGNNVPTNVAGDDQSFVTASGITKAFPQPKVNVKDILKLSNVTNTVFYGDKLSDGDITMLQSTMNKNNQLKDMDESGAYSPIQPGQLTVYWYSTLGENDALSGEITDLKGDLADKLANPQTETPHTCYLQITYPMAASTDESADNTDKNIAGTAAIGQSGLATASNDGQTAVNGTTPAETAEMNGKPYGVYTNNIIKGQLEITKTIDEPYTNIKQINANQTFVFKIERYEVDQNGNKRKLAETFYETINFNANETGTEKTKLVSGLKKGYYTVTEESNWSQKYELKTTTDNYDKNNNNNGQEAVDLLIGDRLKEATQDNPKPEFYGLDETKLKNNNGEELPPAQQYSNFAEGSKATVKFTNNLSTTWKWLSDTAAAVNVFDQKAQ